MINKILLCALTVCLLSDAAMIGDFSPMKVGNKWVYTYHKGFSEVHWYERIIKILSMSQINDSIFYTTNDSLNGLYLDSGNKESHENKYLGINNSIFIYDSSSKKYVEPTEDIFKFHQLPDSILKIVTFLSQSIYSYSIESGASYCTGFPLACSYQKKQWIQNYGLYYSDTLYRQGQMGSGYYCGLKLVSFNDQPVDTPITAIMPKSPSLAPSGNPLLYTNTRNQITWRGLSAQDRLCLQLYDYRGKLLFFSRQLPGTYVLNTSRYSSGAFLLRYQVNNGIWRQFPIARN